MIGGSGFAAEDWDHGEYLTRSHSQDVGAVVCAACGYQRKHNLNWPPEAYSQIEYKGQALWAFDRESAAELLDYVSSEDRDRRRFKWRSSLMQVPSHFLRKGAREPVSRKLRKLLDDSSFNRRSTSD